jgi:hypothetical protein
MTRRPAWIVLVAFLAGPAINGTCLFSCAGVEHVGIAEACHGKGAQGPAFATGDDCGVERASLSPFVKGPDRPPVTSALLTTASSVELELRISLPPAARAAAHGPPFVRTLIPLRI